MNPRPARALLALAAAAALAGAWPAAAADTPAVDQRPAWTSLTPAQRAALSPLQRDWASIDASRKQKWLEVAGRFPGMPPAERQRVQERMSEWARMTPAERGRARLQFQETRQFSPEDRQARWEAYKALPDDERRALAQKAKPASRPASVIEPKAIGPTQKHQATAPEHQPHAKTVAPTLVQAKPGASTSLITPKPTTPPTPFGQPKIAATEGFVNPKTLLPQRGPQGAAVHSAAASAPSTQR